jgi:hypothetical protein
VSRRLLAKATGDVNKQEQGSACGVQCRQCLDFPGSPPDHADDRHRLGGEAVLVVHAFLSTQASSQRGKDCLLVVQGMFCGSMTRRRDSKCSSKSYILYALTLQHHHSVLRTLFRFRIPIASTLSLFAHMLLTAPSCRLSCAARLSVCGGYVVCQIVETILNTGRAWAAHFGIRRLQHKFTQVF